MAYNKVEANGKTLIDLTSDTVTAGTLLQGETAHDRSGAQIEGAVIVAPTDVTETEDNTAYLYKNSEHDAVYDELSGGSVAWNQLVANSGSSLSVTITSGHKYIMEKSGTLSVGASSGSAITGLTGGTDWITDLTQMFGSTIADYVYNLEQSTAGSGIVWLKSYGFFTEDYYAYNAGALTSVNVSGKKVVSETTEITYPIQSTDLRGLYKLNGNNLYTDGDIYSADGTVTRKYGIVDLGTLNWGMTTGNRFYANVEQGSAGIITNALCAKYVVTNTTFSSLQDKEMNYGQPVASIDWRAVAVRDSAYTDATTFKTSMSGVYLIYELATPTTAHAQPFTSPQMVYRNGTEEYLDTRDVPIPVGGNRKYVDIPDWMVNEYFDDLRISADAQQAQLDKALEQTGYNLVKITATTQTVNGITLTVDEKAGTITANGTATALTAIPLSESLLNILEVGNSYYMTGCPAGGSYSSNYALYVALNGATVWRDEGSGEQYSVPQSGSLSALHLVIRSGVTVNNLVFKPMIVPAELAGVPFQPYAKSNAELTQDLDDISGELDCLLIQAALVNNEVIIQNTSDFTDELYSKYFSYTKPKFAILKLQITSNTHYYKALINSLSVSQGNLMEASFITVNGGYMGIYNFRWNFSSTVGTPTVSYTSLNLGS